MDTHITSESQLFDQQDQTYHYAPTPGYFEPLATPSIFSLASSTQQPSPDKIELLQLSDWEEGRDYKEDPPTTIHYSIEWKVTINNRVVAKDTEPDLVLTPSAYWDEYLCHKLEERVKAKTRRSQRIKSEDTAIVLSVNDRSHRDLNKWFKKTNIDWSTIEQQLVKWGNLFCIGKQLTLKISFNYTGDNYATQTPSRKGDKRGLTSVTQRMLDEREDRINAEDASGQPSVWENVYKLMRCPGPPCNLGQWCWLDPIGKKHYNLKTYHLKSLVKYVQEGHGTLETHDDVPDWIREQLYEEERQKLKRKRSKSPTLPTNGTPINIHVLPAQSSQPSMLGNTSEAPAMSPSLNACLIKIPGPRDIAVRRYSKWQESNVVDETLKADFRNACDIAIENGLDLEQVYKDQDPEFFIKNGVKIGIARRFVDDISDWAKQDADDADN
ncbi:hypothetical protein FQN50_009940 [Emmonsiellopsis sp. PD_5]|nr:hypothetical protein FQN50_009940 [Emmonsiellopsis sp. PD_5]